MMNFFPTLLLLVAILAATSEAAAFYPSSSLSKATSTSLNMSGGAEDTPVVKEGDVLPSVVLQQGQPDYSKPIDVDLRELLAKHNKVAIFAVPGAFTPGCSKSHLPSFIDAQDELKSKGVDLTICIATNDAYVMEAWGRTSGGADGGIMFLSDGKDAKLTRALGLSMGEGGVMVRSKRYSMIVDGKSGVVEKYFSADESSENTWAPSVLSKL